MKNFSWKLISVFGVIVTAIVYMLPTFHPGLWPHNQINLGLDLQGGMHLVLEVDTAKAVEGQVERISQEVLDQLKKERIRKVSL
ncbi:MAG: protein translocase subunit SecD, partial [Desulfobacterales bacterium]